MIDLRQKFNLIRTRCLKNLKIQFINIDLYLIILPTGFISGSRKETNSTLDDLLFVFLTRKVEP